MAVAEAIGLGVNIDEAPVDFALGRAATQRGHGPAEGLVDQHRAVDERD